MQFGDVLRHLIEDNNLTQKQLGEELNIAPTTIGNYVRNLREPDYATLKLFASYFHVSTDYLLDYPEQDGLTHRENQLLHIYRELSDEYRDILSSQACVLYKSQLKR